MRTTEKNLNQCIAELYASLSHLSSSRDQETLFGELRHKYEETRNDLKEEILKTLQDCPPARELSESLIHQYGWKELYLRSFTFWFLFYISWLWIQLGIKLEAQKLESIFRVWVFGTFGYRLLDLFLDESKTGDQEAIVGLWLIAEHESGLLDFFGHDVSTARLIHEGKDEWFAAELQEKKCRGKCCPISIEDPLECAYKAAPIFSLFALPLHHYGYASAIKSYKELIYKLIATTQILDDISDLEDDLTHDFFTLPASGLEDVLLKKTPAEGAELVRSDSVRMKRMCTICCDLASSASHLAAAIEDPVFQVYAEYKLLLIRRIFFARR